VARILFILFGALEDEDDIAFRSGGEVEAAAIAADPLVAFGAHAVGHNHDGGVAFERTHVGGANAEVAGGGSDDGVYARLDFAGEFTFEEGAVGGSDLVAAGGKVAAGQDEDVAIDAGEFLREEFAADVAIGPAPGDPVEVGGIEFVRTVDGEAVQHLVVSGTGDHVSYEKPTASKSPRYGTAFTGVSAWAMMITALSFGVSGEVVNSNNLSLAAMLVLAAGTAFAQSPQTCIAHHPNYIEGNLEIDYAPGCTGHDEPEIFPISSHPGSGRELTWTVVLPTDGSASLVSDVGPTFWFGGVVSDPKSLLGQAFVELQFYGDSLVKNCFPNGAFSLSYSPNTYTVCSPVWSVTSSGQSGKFKEPAAFNAMLVDSANPSSPLVMKAGDTITIHWYTTAAQDGFHVTVTDLSTGHAGTIVLNSATSGPLMPAYDVQAVGNSLAWGLVNDAPNAFVWEIGHRSVYGSSPGAFCSPGQAGCDSYNAASWAGFSPLQILGVTFGDGSSPSGWGVVSDTGGIAEVNATCSVYGGPFCIYPWYSLTSAAAYNYGVDYSNTKTDFKKASQFSQTTKCGGPFGANTTYCSTILK